ncbi:MAG: hypothetical protein IKI77_11520 [Oscillospiraceae bacterium]|nr:hypothetical protein [Oscillospiraceae bacterium]
MRHVFVCPMDDTIEIAMLDITGDYRVHGGINFVTFQPKEPPLYPYVPAYFQDYNHQRAPLRNFLRDETYGFRPRDYLLALHDDATDLEAHALSELLIACGAKETLMEYRAFLLSSEDSYIAVTGSKRAVTVTLVMTALEDTDRIFIPINEAVHDTVFDAVRELDPSGKLPVYRFGVPEALSGIGEMVNAAELIRNFIKIL